MTNNKPETTDQSSEKTTKVLTIAFNIFMSIIVLILAAILVWVSKPHVEKLIPEKPTTTPTITLTPTPLPTRKPTSTPTITPTYTVLRGEVLQRANCRYGPGAPYLYKYGLVKGSNLEVIGRLDDASWIQIQAIGGDNPCWVKTSLMDVKGDPLSVEPIYPDKAPLPVSPYYPPLTGVKITREGTQVTITWIGQALRAGDEENENSPLYVVEVWACQDGELQFTPHGTFQEKLTITDQTGCKETSHGRLYFAEKHGYAGPTEFQIPLP